MEKMNRKGQLEMFGNLGIGIAVLAIVLVVAFMILSEGKDVVKDKIASTAITNETITWSEGTYVTLTYSPSSIELSCSQILNGTEVIPTTEYDCNTRGVNITNTSSGYNAKVNVTYSYKWPDLAYNGTSTMQSATDDVPGWVPIVIITAIGAALILMVKRYGR